MVRKLDFKDLHKTEQPLELLNVWDNESTAILVQKNIDFIATSSYAKPWCF